ncbi:MAG: GTPase HflX [Anaerolineales bacterium]|jgi:GTP-binding protein HflX
MSKKITEPTERPQEKAFLVGVEIYNQERLLSVEDSITELSLLAETAGLIVVGQATQKLSAPNPKTFIGAGKIQEIHSMLSELQTDILIFDDELSPRHLRELEKIFEYNIRIIDRTALILDIFAQHANTAEGSLQVELAQYEYRLPRLTRAWTHLARQAGGGGGRAGSVGGVGLRGPGETQLEVDRRDIRRRISFLKDRLEKVRVHRKQHRSQRKKSNIPVVALVGYTNAGKSTLLNYLSKSNVYVADKLFATLDPTVRRINLPNGNISLFSDTVGFIQKLPTTLVAAFRATLEEITESDLLLHIIDVTHPNALSQSEAVFQTLEGINADNIPTISVLNKIDLLDNPNNALDITNRFENASAISALKGDGVKELLSQVEGILFSKNKPISVNIPYNEGSLISQFHQYGIIKKIEHSPDGIYIQGLVPVRILDQYLPYEIKTISALGE